MIATALPDGWLTRNDMAAHLGISPVTLRTKWLFLKKEIHYRQGPHRNSPCIYDVAATVAACRERGYVLPCDLRSQG